MRALIDGDPIVYQSGFAAQHNFYTLIWDEGNIEFNSKTELNNFVKVEDISNYTVEARTEVEDVGNAIHNVKSRMADIQIATGATDYTLFLSGQTNFRKEIYPEYKANRDPSYKPVHYDELRKYMVDVWNAVVVEGEEADDALGINQEDETIICTIDKDLNMIAGWHYNWDSKDLYFVNERDALNSFYVQLLTGDSTDNIPGLFKITGKKASKAMKEQMCRIEDEEYKWAYAVELYGEENEEMLIDIATLLWIRREGGEIWGPPV